MQNPIPLDFGDSAGSRQTIAELQEHLNQDGVIAYPTDTFYGLGANPFQSRAVDRIFEIKGRPEDKPLLVLIDHPRRLADLIREIPKTAEPLLQQLWPGPLTLVFEARPDLPKNLTANTGTLGVRLPGHAFTQQLLSALDMPLTAPSANLSGTDNCSSAEQVWQTFKDDIRIVDGGNSPGDRASTVLDVTVHPPRLIREGAVSREKLESVLRMPLAKTT